MRIAEENWKVLALLFPPGWQQMAWQSGAVERLRGFPSPDVLLRMLMLHVARDYSLRETFVRAELANWADISDVALLQTPAQQRGVAAFVVFELLRENVGDSLHVYYTRSNSLDNGKKLQVRGETHSRATKGSSRDLPTSNWMKS